MSNIKSKLTATGVKRESLQVSVKELVADYMYRIDTDADYQREKVWSKADQELLLDSIVKDIDIPKLYLARVSDGREYDFECIDGKQRLLTLSAFCHANLDESSPLRLDILNKQYTYKQLQKDLPSIAKSIDDYKLDFVIYNEATLTEGFVREIFKRLQLGIRLNSGELLNAQLGTLRDFVFKEMGKDGPYLKRTKLSDKRYSRQFTLAQICINSFQRHVDGDFTRARLSDLQEFFDKQSTLSTNDDNLVRIRRVLRVLDAEFGDHAQCISSRATAVSAYLFVEQLVTGRKTSLVRKFVRFYIALLRAIELDMGLISRYDKPKNHKALDHFQKYVLQASVEPYAIKRRDDFLKEDFAHYLKNHPTKASSTAKKK